MIQKIDLYTTPTCTHCKFIKKYLHDHNLVYQEHDLAEDEAAREFLAEKIGRFSIPVLIIDQTEVIIGFDQNRLDKLLFSKR